MRASTERMCRRVDGKISFQLTTSRRRSRYQQARTTDAADSRLQRSPDPLDAPPVRLRSSRDLCHPRLDHLGRTFLTESSPGVIGGCGARTQPRQAQRVAERGDALGLLQEVTCLRADTLAHARETQQHLIRSEPSPAHLPAVEPSARPAPKAPFASFAETACASDRGACCARSRWLCVRGIARSHRRRG